MPNIQFKKYGGSVYAIYVYKGEKLKISTNIRIADQHWSYDYPNKNCPNRESIIQRIAYKKKFLIKVANDISSSGLEPSIEKVKKVLFRPFAYTYTPSSEFKDERSKFFKNFDEYFTKNLNFPNYHEMHNLRKILVRCSKDTPIGEEFKLCESQFKRLIHYLRILEFGDYEIRKYTRLLRSFMKVMYYGEDLAWMIFSNFSRKKNK